MVENVYGQGHTHVAGHLRCLLSEFVLGEPIFLIFFFGGGILLSSITQ